MQFQELYTYRLKPAPRRHTILFSGNNDVRVRPGPEAFCRVERAMVGKLAVGRVRSTGHDVTLSEHVSANVVVPVSGQLMSTVRGRDYVARPGQALLFSPNSRDTSALPGDDSQFLGVPVLLPARDLETAAERLGAPVRRVMFDDFALRLDGGALEASGELIAMIRVLVGEITRGSRRLENERTRENWSRMVAEKVVETLEDTGVLDLPRPVTGRPAARHVQRALEVMREKYAEIATMIEVADACGVTNRTLQQSFREVLGTTPRAALTEFRLDEARRLLTLPKNIQSVTDIAFATGFGHPGRFAIAYRQRFGEAPSETRAQRGGVPSAGGDPD